MPTSTVRRKLCESGLYDGITVKKSLLRKQNNVKRPRHMKTGQYNSRIKSSGLKNQSIIFFSQIDKECVAKSC